MTAISGAIGLSPSPVLFTPSLPVLLALFSFVNSDIEPVQGSALIVRICLLALFSFFNQ
jgi:hypothetical protein